MVTIDCVGKLPAGVSAADLRDWAGRTLKRAGHRGPATMSVRVTGDAVIRKLNRQHRGKDKVTDILSFSATEGLPKVMTAGAKGELGDLVISLPQVRRQAKAIGRSVRAEFALMIVHGTLHLLGFDHESLADEKKMFGLQHDVLITAGIL